MIAKSNKKVSEKKNKFDDVVSNLNEQENQEREKAKKVVKVLTGDAGQTKTITDKNGRTRTVKVAEKRKTMPVYIPMGLYERFDAINTAYGKSNNSAIVELIRDYVTEKQEVLKNI